MTNKKLNQADGTKASNEARTQLRTTASTSHTARQKQKYYESRRLGLLTL
jgi:hypothetical protein